MMDDDKTNEVSLSARWRLSVVGIVQALALVAIAIILAVK